ncbi:MAG: RNA polymerase sigma factor [Bacteroidota bacterium]
MTAVRDIHSSLIERCKRGDRKAQYELYRQYAKAMFNVSVRISNDYMEAEDVLQEAFVRAFKHINSFKGESTFGAWLKRIVVNTAINHLRKKKVDFIDLEQVAYGQLPEPTHEPEAIPSCWTMDEIRQAIGQLPDGYRLVFSLYVIEGYDHGEISQVLDISEATSKSQFSRAKKKLRELLNERLNERKARKTYRDP